MTNLEETIIRELSTLPESRRADVLAFIRFLKISLPNKEKTNADFKIALKEARATAKKYKITPSDVETEIRAVRDSK